MSTTLQEVRRTLALAFPMILGQVGQFLMHVIDTIMIGRATGVDGGGVTGVAASTAVSNITGVCFMFGFGLCVPVHVLASQALGAGEPGRAVSVLRHGLWFAVAYAVLVGAAFSLFPGVFGLFGFPEEVIAAGTPYGVLLAWSLVPVLAYQVLRNYWEANHRPWEPLLVLVGALLLNVLLNAVLIYGWGPIAPRGLVGAGEATLLARFAAVAALAVLLVRGRRFPVRPRDLLPRGLRRGEFRECATIGLPSATQITIEGGTFTLAAILVGWLGTTALAAHQVALNFAALTFMVPLGMSFATSIRVGHAHGAGDMALARRVGLGSIGFAAALGAGFGIVFFAFRGVLPRLFFDAADPAAGEVLALASTLLVVAALFQVFDGMQVTALASLRGRGDVRVPTVLVLVGYWAVAIPISFLLAFGPEHPLPEAAPLLGGLALPFGAGLGTTGVWAGLAAGLGAVALLLTLRFERSTRPEGGSNNL